MAHSFASAPEFAKNTCPPAGEPSPMRRSSIGGQALVELVAEQIRNMHQSRRLSPDRFGHTRVGVPDRDHGDAAEKVQVPAPLVVEQLRPASGHEPDGRRSVRRHEHGRGRS